MNNRLIVMIGGIAAVAGAGMATRRLLQKPEIRTRLGLDRQRDQVPHRKSDSYVDMTSADSFPASDPPSF